MKNLLIQLCILIFIPYSFRDRTPVLEYPEQTGNPVAGKHILT